MMKISDHQFEQLAHLVRASSRLLLISHKKPDGDTTGATTAFARWCHNEGKDVTLYCQDKPAETFQYLFEVRNYTNDPNVFERAYDLVIIFDSGDPKYAGVDTLLPRIKPGYTLVNIDHHQTNQRYGDLNLVEMMSSTSEIVYRFFEVNRIKPDTEMATSLLTGICTDTSNFSNPLTSESAILAASHLTSDGARFNEIIKFVWRNKSIESLRLWGKMLDRLKENKTYDIVSTYITNHEMQSVGCDVAEGLTNFLSGVLMDVDTVLLFKELPNRQIRGSLRSQNRDISKLAKFFGGGGHRGAAGFTVNASLKDLGIG